MEVNGYLYALVGLTPLKKKVYPLQERLCLPQDWYGRFGEGKNLLSLTKSNPGSFSPRSTLPCLWNRRFKIKIRSVTTID